jgi:(E)-4-hydroxy-3-methylbut-2-enyl-diphosphate synthase
MEKSLKIAVMGCVVNGPGEAKEADIGVAGGKGVGIIFKKGKLHKKVAEEELLDVFLDELDSMVDEKE